MKRARLINNRPTCFVALFIIVGLIVAESLYGVNQYYYLIPAVLSALVAIGLFSFRKTRKFCYMAIAFLVGFLALTGANDIYDARVVQIDDYAVVECKVDSEIVVGERTEFYVKDLWINGTAVDGRAKVFLSGTDTPDYGAGDIIIFTAKVVSNDHERFDTSHSAAYSSEYYYRAFSNTSAVTKLASGKPGFPRSLQLNIKRMFYENLDSKTSAICQALVLGDKFGMDDDLMEDVQVSGLAHVLAVSGLHITTLASALYFLLKKLKVKPKTSLIVVTILTFLYSMLCSFTPSSLRAFVMTFVLNYASANGLKQDNLSSLALATSILLIVNPTNILSVGFLLSVSSVLGIFIAYRPLNNLGMRAVEKISPKRNIGKRLVESCSLSFSANLISMPFAANFFGTVPLLFIASNLVILPYLMFIYLILLFITLFAQITTLWGVTFVMQPLLFPFIKWVEFVGNIEWAQLNIEIAVVFMVFWIIGCLACSDFVFLTKRTKKIIALVLTTCFLVVQVLSFAIA